MLYIFETVMKSRQTGDYNPVMFPLSAMGDVVMEVLIPPGGTELMPRTRSRNIQIVEVSFHPVHLLPISSFKKEILTCICMLRDGTFMYILIDVILLK